MRVFVFRRDRYRCVRCKKAGQLHGHHVRSIALHPNEDIAFHLDPEWIVTLCRRCHYDKRTHPFSPKTKLQLEHAAWDRAVREL